MDDPPRGFSSVLSCFAVLWATTLAGYIFSIEQCLLTIDTLSGGGGKEGGGRIHIDKYECAASKQEAGE